jgi:hypothetical protein
MSQDVDPEGLWEMLEEFSVSISEAPTLVLCARNFLGNLRGH